MRLVRRLFGLMRCGVSSSVGCGLVLRGVRGFRAACVIGTVGYTVGGAVRLIGARRVARIVGVFRPGVVRGLRLQMIVER